MLNPVARIQASFTDSAERVGRDTATCGLIIIMAIVGLLAGQGATSVACLVGVVAIVVIAVKFTNAYVDSKAEEAALDRLRAERGEALLTKHQPAQITRRKKPAGAREP